jgi:hypothetical protein
MERPIEIKPIDIDRHLKKCPKMYFGPDGASEEGVLDILKETAEILGAKKIQKFKIENLSCVASDFDWLKIDNEYGLSEDNVFDRMWPFPEAGINSARVEVIARVYSSILVSARKNKLVVHQGSISREHENKIKELVKKYERVICFQYENNS